ncbi:MAG: hypothetical protein QOF78_4566 [Phycisphaerales bacterium]|jgi:hypothetical protein|nr:hypothetical protein [Phycisphaerales bacterium]
MARSNQSRASKRNSRSHSGGSRASGSKGNPDSASRLTRGYDAGRQRGRVAVDSIKSAGSRAVESVGEHPIPAALIGAGLAWLLLESRGIRPTEAQLVERGKEAIGGIGHTIGDAVSTAASTVKESASSAASAVGETASSGLDYSREAIGNMWERHPLAMSAAILSAGIAAGMLLPATKRENNLLGGAASNLAKSVGRKGSELIEHGRELAASTAKAVGGESSGGRSANRRRSGGSSSSSSRSSSGGRSKSSARA